MSETVFAVLTAMCGGYLFYRVLCACDAVEKIARNFDDK